MNQHLNNFLERPTSHKVAFWVFSFVFFGYLFWQYFYSANAAELTELRERRDSLESQIVHERRLARNLEKIRAEVKELDVKLKFAMQELPDRQEIPDILSSVSDLATASGLDVDLFKTRPEILREFYAEVPVTISVEGTYHNVATFFDEVGHLPRIININQVAIRNPRQTEQGMQVQVDCTATAFRFLDESERVQIEEPKKKGRRRK